MTEETEQNRAKAMEFVRKMLRAMKERDASDLYVVAGMRPSMKVFGEMTPAGANKLTPDQARLLVEAAMNDKDRAFFHEHGECNFAISLPEEARFRVNAYVQRGSPAMVVRTIADEIPPIDKLYLPDVIRDIAMTKRGLVIFVGGTGSGKSTALASMIDYRNANSSGHIITVEDPIEFTHEHQGCAVSQREVGTDTESWEAALKNTLRQAPDVILIGEIRDRETMEHAIAFAETGHLCLSTLHANSTNQAMDRIINFFPEERREQLLMDLSLNTRAIVSQRLIKTKDGQGRRPAVEVLLNSPAMQDLIGKGKVSEMKELMAKSREAGMQRFDDALFDLVEKGDVSEEEALRNADSANDLRLNLKLKGSGGGNVGDEDNGLSLTGGEEADESDEVA